MTTATAGDQIARRGSAAARGLTLERYVETMMPRWGNNSVKRWTRRGRAGLEREDLRSEAALVLTEVWNRYAHVKPEAQLRRMGTGAIFKHVGNVFYHFMPWATKPSRLRGHVAPRMVSADGPASAGAPRGEFHVNPIDRHQIARHGRAEPQLESLIAREEAETLPVADFRGGSADAVRKIFSAAVRALRDDDGYLLMEAARQLNYNQRGDIKMLDGATMVGPVSPDVQDRTLSESGAEKPFSAEQQKIYDDATGGVRAAKVAKADKPLKVKINPKPAAGKKPRPSAQEAAARVATFKKGQRVKYRGGARTAIRGGAVLTVLGSVKSKGRMYVRLVSADGENFTLSGALVSKL